MADILQEWELCPVDVGDETFTASMIPIQGSEDEELTADIYIAGVNEWDRDMIEIGAPFRWTITKAGGSSIWARRLPPFTAEQIRVAKARAQELKAILDA